VFLLIEGDLDLHLPQLSANAFACEAFSTTNGSESFHHLLNLLGTGDAEQISKSLTGVVVRYVYELLACEHGK
jgi:hypothetical protein